MGGQFFVVCDGLKGLPDSVKTVSTAGYRADLQHPPDPGSFRYVSRKYWDELSRDLKPIYTADTVAAAAAALDVLQEKWAARYPVMTRLWRNAWEEFIPLLDYDVAIRKINCCNTIESINARYRRAARPADTSPTSKPR